MKELNEVEAKDVNSVTGGGSGDILHNFTSWVSKILSK